MNSVDTQKYDQVLVCVLAATPSCQQDAEQLAQQLNLPLADEITNNPRATDYWELKVADNGLSLMRPDGLTTQIDFINGKAVRRAQEKNLASQPLARALGLQKLRKVNPTPSIIDATAGYGTDGWMMASLNCDVRLIEASPILSVMLERAIQTAREHDTGVDLLPATSQQVSEHTAQTSSTAHKLSVVNADAVSYLNDAATQPSDIVYLDPMYPASRNSALVKKGMQLLHELVGEDKNGSSLLDAALHKAEYRVIVKRPKGAKQLAGTQNWSGQITQVQSAQTRFDVYHMGTGQP